MRPSEDLGPWWAAAGLGRGGPSGRKVSQADVGELERPAGPRDAEGAAQATLGGPASLRPAGGGAPQGAWLGLPTEGRGRGAEGRGVGHLRGQRGRSGVAGRPREGGGAGPPGGVSLACGCRAETGLSLIAFIFVCFLFLLLTSGLLLLLLCPPSPCLLPCAPRPPCPAPPPLPPLLSVSVLSSQLEVLHYRLSVSSALHSPAQPSLQALHAYQVLAALVLFRLTPAPWCPTEHMSVPW